MKLVKLPGTKIAVNPAWVTCVKDNSDAVTYKKEPVPHISVHYCYGVQQGEARIKDASFDEVIALLNQ